MYKNIALWIIIALGMAMMYQYFNESHSVDLPYSAFISQISNGSIKKVAIKENKITGEDTSGKRFETYFPTDEQLIPMLKERGVEIHVIPTDTTIYMILSWAPMILLVVFWMFFMRQMQGGGKGGAFSFGKSKAKMQDADKNKVTFKDVAGVEEAKEELEEIIDFLKDPKKFQKLGGKIPKGVLLVGPPGTGKTLLAKAVAGEAGVPFFYMSGSDFVEMFVGVGASRVRDLFEQGKKHAPCILFLDEIDAVGRHRGAGLGGGHDEREQTLNALLVEMDGFDSSEGVIMVAATNRADVLDPALLRPGRFDRKVIVPNPDYRGRLAILEVHAKKVPLADGVKLDDIAKGTPGFAGAELANLINEAALLAARRNKERVDIADLEEAKDKVMMGKERRSAVISEREKRNTAYHESGHAIVARMTAGADPLHKLTIIPRGAALGLTMQLPQDDKYTITKDYLLGRISIMMAGRAAEKLVFDHYSTGASNDLERATKIARNMVTTYGMSDKVGPVTYSKHENTVFLGRELSSGALDYSEQTKVLVDGEISGILNGCADGAMKILSGNRTLLDKMSDLLMEQETINGDDVTKLINEYADEKWREVAAKNLAEQETENSERNK
ncbi:ATP-dependent zinc metalloprotease FtsH [Deferribacterales bacterium RsTz2092]|nr:ATP-dependent zinc metalloprotease FtsH [Deferribacterales bacterium]